MERQSDYPPEGRRAIAGAFAIRVVAIAVDAIGFALLLNAANIGGGGTTTDPTGADTTETAPADSPLGADRSAMDGARDARVDSCRTVPLR